MMGVGCRGCGGRCRIRPHCRPGTCSLNSRSSSECSGQRCRAQRRRWRHEELGRPQIRAWISCRSLWRDARGGENQNQIQFRHRRSGRSRSLGGKSSCPKMISIAQPRHLIALPKRDESCPMCHPKSPCQLCSDLLHSCWPHLPCR